MIKAIDGSFIFHARKPGQELEHPATTGDGRNLPERLSMNMLRARLCSLGPGYCPRCRLCEYGVEYLKRRENGK